MKKWENEFWVGIYKCKMTYSTRDGIASKWSPHLPKRGLSAQEREQYRSGRDNLLAEVSRHMGGSVLVIET